MEKFNGRDSWAFVMRTNVLASVTAPGGATFFHEHPLLLGKLALLLGDMREAGGAGHERSRRTGGKASTAGEALSPTARLDGTDQVGGEVGDDLTDEYVGAVFFIDDQAILSLYTKSRLNCGVDFVNRTMVSVAL